MNGIRWQKWVGQYNESLGQFGKTHATENDIHTACGVSIPDRSEANIEGESIGSVNCKRCKAKADTYTEESRLFDLGLL